MTALAIQTESNEPWFSWREALVLKAAAQAECVPFRAFLDEEPGMIKHQVFLSLMYRGMMKVHPLGYSITEKGRLEASILQWMEAHR